MILQRFRPLPLLANPHVQTVLANLWKGSHPSLPVRRHHILLEDGDMLVLHDSQPRFWQRGDAIVMLAHGLGGSHRSGDLLRLSGLLFPRGLRVIRIDLRGAGAGAKLAKHTYNGGSSNDLRCAIAFVHRLEPASAVLLGGFSLGGNIVLKLAGEAARRPVPGLKAVAAISAPIDLASCARLIAQHPFYDRFFVRGMIRQVRRLQRLHPDVPRVRFPRHMTLNLFDELYTAPQGGFRDAQDYYRRSSASPLMNDIRIPTFLLTAADDPFVAAEPYRTLPAMSQREVHVVDQGGHLGFLGWDGAGGVRWANRRLAEWLLSMASG